MRSRGAKTCVNQRGSGRVGILAMQGATSVVKAAASGAAAAGGAQEPIRFGVLVTGFKRSGTSLMMEMLRRAGFAPHFDADFEHYLVHTYAAQNEYFYEDAAIVHGGAALCDARLAQLAAGRQAAKVFAYGVNDAVRRAAAAGTVRVVMMRRHESAIKSSIAAYKGGGGGAGAGGKAEQGGAGAAAAAAAQSSPPPPLGHRSAAEDFAELGRIDMGALGAQLGALEVQFEELIADPRGTVRRLLTFLSVSVPPEEEEEGGEGGLSGDGDDDDGEAAGGGGAGLRGQPRLVDALVAAVQPGKRHH